MGKTSLSSIMWYIAASWHKINLAIGYKDFLRHMLLCILCYLYLYENTMVNVYYLPYLGYANSQIRDKREQSIENSTFFVCFDNVYLKSFELVYLSTHNTVYNSYDTHNMSL